MPEPNFPPADLPENNPDQVGTVFPALDRSTPGDGGEQSQDITSVPLDPMVSDDPAIKEATQFSPGATPSDGAVPPLGEPVQVAGAEIDPPQKRRPRTYQDRINRLTRNYRGAQEKNEVLETQIGDLTQAIIQLQNKNGAPAQQPVPAPAGDAASVFASPGESGGTETPPAAGKAGPVLTADAIAGIVRREIHSYDQEVVQRNSAVSDLVKKQELSYAEAVEEFPELSDPKSAATRTFREVYSTSPLRELEDAPYQIALQVRGILSAGAVTDAGKTQKKQQAAVVVPQTSQSVGNASGVNVSALNKEMAQLAHARKNGNNDFRVYKRWREVRELLKRAQSQT